MPWIVMGAGQTARMVASHLDCVRRFVIDDEYWTGPECLLDGTPVIPASWLVGTDNSQFHSLLPLPVVSAIMSPKRHVLAGRLRAEGFMFRPVVAPGAHIHRTAHVGNGSFVNVGATVDLEATIGGCVLINRGATVGYQAVVRDFATVGPGAHLAGGVTVGMMATVGMGALVREGVTVGPSAVVGMGAVVLKDVPAGETWVGVPARRIR